MEKLQRQRALLQEHLRWLESEIAREASVIEPPASPERAPELPKPEEPIAPVSPAATDASEEKVALPEPDVRGLHSEVRSGCLLYFAIASVVLGAIVLFIYWRY